ncbi:MAG TPA: hypothetical protein VNM67_03465 [Thermoanaerobaculia bacterium]|jgi:hypothetical protein|nr:hypothetical protein [Thermoanaerobaculia bacterium]
MRKLLVLLTWALLAMVVTVVWAVFHPDSVLVAKAEQWRWVGPYAQELRRRGPEPFSIPPEGTGEQMAEEIPAPAAALPPPDSSAGGAG